MVAAVAACWRCWCRSMFSCAVFVVGAVLPVSVDDFFGGGTLMYRYVVLGALRKFVAVVAMCVEGGGRRRLYV